MVESKSKLEGLVRIAQEMISEFAVKEEQLPGAVFLKDQGIEIVALSGGDPRILLRWALDARKPDMYVLYIEARQKPMKMDEKALEIARNYKRGDLAKDTEAQDCLIVYGVENGGRKLASLAGVEGEVPQRKVLPWIRMEGLLLGNLVATQW